MIQTQTPNQVSDVVPVIHFIAELSIGGAQSALLRLVSHLDAQRYRSTVVCLYNGDGVIARKLKAHGIPVIDLGMTGKHRIDAIWRLFRLLKEQRPAILHTWMFHANILGRLTGHFAGVPIIISSERTMGQEGAFRRWLDRLTASWATRIICVSKSVADFAAEIIHLPPGKIETIPNGIELDQYLHLPTQQEARRKYHLSEMALIIGAIGRPRPVKGYPYLISAFAQIKNIYPTSRLIFVGNGPDQPRLLQQAQDCGLSDRIHFFEDQPDIINLLPALDLLAVPSFFEGMPNVVLEAMAAGLPVVATEVGGTPEVVNNTVTGYLVPPANPAELAGAISKLLSDPEQRLRMGQAGRERVYAEFNIKKTVEQTQMLYESLIRK